MEIMEKRVSSKLISIANILSLSRNDFIFHDVVEDCINPLTNAPLLKGDETPQEKYQIFRDSHNFFDYDADVSFQAMSIAGMVYPYADKEKAWYLELQDKKEFMYELRSDKENYMLRGDTMNSVATTVREYRKLFGKEIILPKEADNLTDIYHTLGNFMLLPYKMGLSINGARGIGQAHDYLDLFLLAIYNWFHDFDETEDKTWTLQRVLGSQEKVDFLIGFLNKTYSEEDRPCWDLFVEWNLLQDYVEVKPDGTFGRPKELWHGHFTGSVMPNTEEHFMEFWVNAADRIIQRGSRIYECLSEKAMKEKTQDITVQGENFVYDIISLLKKWGLWSDIFIFYNGKKYSDFVWGEDEITAIKGFRDMEDVYISDNENPEDYLGEGVGEISEELSSICVVNETLLRNIIMEGYYEINWDQIGPEAREYLLDVNGGNLLLEEYGYDAEELGPVLDSTEFEAQAKYQEFEEEMQNDLYMEYVKGLSGRIIHCMSNSVVDHIMKEWLELGVKYGVHGTITIYV